MEKYTKNIFPENVSATMVSNYFFKIHEKEGKYYRIRFWDCVGGDFYFHLVKIFAKKAQGCVIMSDATVLKSREE